MDVSKDRQPVVAGCDGKGTAFEIHSVHHSQGI